MNKLMKLSLLAISMIVAISLQSCSKDEVSKKDVIGTWKLSEVSTDDGKTFTKWPFVTTIATFKENGTYIGKGYFGNGEGTWNLEGNTLKTYVDDKEYIKYEVIELSGSTATLKISVKNSSIQVKCVRI